MPSQRRVKDWLAEKKDHFFGRLDSLKVTLMGRTPVGSRCPSPKSSVIPLPATISPSGRTSELQLTNKEQPIDYQQIISPGEDMPPGRTTELVSVGLQGLKTTLLTIERAADIFTPLKSAVGAILGVVEVVETTRQNRQDYEDLEQRLRTVVSMLDRHNNNRLTTSSAFEHRLESFSAALSHQIVSIRTKYEHSLARRAAESRADAGDITASYRTLSYLFDAFLIDTALETENTTQKILSNVLFDHLPTAKRAAYNASSPAPRRACTAKTREMVLAELETWALDRDDTRIYWLDGMAGTGKTTIAYTLSEILDNCDLLGASFFCSRLDTDSSNANLIFPTIAYELASRLPTASSVLLGALAEDRNAGYKSMRDQFRNLIVKPINAASELLRNSKPLVVIIDALDECSDQKAVRDLVSILFQCPKNLQLKFFVTSRPERQIQNIFEQEGNATSPRLILHDVEKSVVTADIAIYVREELAAIAKRRNLNAWPPADSLTTLVRLAGNLFIYAATACKYIDDGGSINDRLLDMTSASRSSSHDGTAALDTLYSGIIATAFKVANTREKREMKQVLQAVVNVLDPLSIDGLAILLEIKRDNVNEALLSLQSVIYVPSSSSDEMTLPVSTFHASFPDFITDHARSGDEYLDRSESHRFLALSCLALMQSSLKENICQLQGQPLKSNVPLSTIQERIPEALAYSCVNWIAHVTQIEHRQAIPTEIYSALDLFLKKRVLQWIECLSLLGRLDVVVGSLLKLESWTQGQTTLRDAVIDVRRFITENFELISQYPLETYSSALVWIPQQSYIRKLYAGSARVKIAWKVVLGLRKSWGACEHILKGHQGYVESVVFSPDGTRIASASMDKTARIWNSATGGLEAELRGHSDWVRSIVFSPDGTRIASAADDKTVRIWNAATGELDAEIKGRGTVNSFVISPDGSHLACAVSDDDTICIWVTASGKLKAELKGHTASVNSVVYSSDGRYIASASSDKSVRIWDTTAGNLGDSTELLGHSGSVSSVVFSPSGSHVASASTDKTIRIWDVVTGEFEAELAGHSAYLRSIIFSPDGSHIASALDDGSVNVWNLSTNELEAELKGHIGFVNSLVFSSDSSRIVSSASDDSIVRIWNIAKTGLEAELGGHSGRVNAVSFSPDGSRVASASNDQTIRIWNAAAGQSEEELQGHSHAVNCIVFSPDGSHVASSSGDTMNDNVIHVWDIMSSQWTVELKGHSRLVKSITFSPDGRQIASASSDKTVRVWNATTGQSELELHGHLDWVNSVAFSDDGTRVVSVSGDGAIRIWNAITGGLQAELKGQSDWMMSVAFCANGTNILSASNHGRVYIWDPMTGKSENFADAASLPSGVVPRHRTNNIYFSPASPSTAVHSSSVDIPWIQNRDSGPRCWIPAQYRDRRPWVADYHTNTVCFGLSSGKVLAVKFQSTD